MRPVNKGISPYVTISHYGDALEYLIARIGAYCSYCEFPINHVPEVEHVESKNSGGNPTDWNNLLLACKYCNTRKKEHIKLGGRSNWIWPDVDNTFLAFTYQNGIPCLNDTYLSTDPSLHLKAKDMFNALKLDNLPNPKQKDRRWKQRLEAYNSAIESLKDWHDVKGTTYSTQFANTIIRIAKASGFFSIWMTVFSGEIVVRNMLISEIVGTAKNCFDTNSNPIVRI